MNTDLPIYIDRAIDLACHEGYPGHHVYNVLLEKTPGADRGWIEFTVYPLFSPQSLIAEGTANYGIEVAFPQADRVALRADVLFPLAGLDAAKRAQEYYEVLDLVDRLSYAGNEAARKYLNGEIDRDGAVAWLEKYAMYTKPRAEQRVQVHRPVPQLRDQLQPRQGSGARLHRAEDGPRSDAAAPLARVHGAAVVAAPAVGTQVKVRSRFTPGPGAAGGPEARRAARSGAGRRRGADRRRGGRRESSGRAAAARQVSAAAGRLRHSRPRGGRTDRRARRGRHRLRDRRSRVRAGGGRRLCRARRGAAGAVLPIPQGPDRHPGRRHSRNVLHGLDQRLPARQAETQASRS